MEHLEAPIQNSLQPTDQIIQSWLLTLQLVIHGILITPYQFLHPFLPRSQTAKLSCRYTIQAPSSLCSMVWLGVTLFYLLVKILIHQGHCQVHWVITTLQEIYISFESKNSLFLWYTNLHDFSNTAKLVQLCYPEILITQDEFLSRPEDLNSFRADKDSLVIFYLSGHLFQDFFCIFQYKIVRVINASCMRQKLCFVHHQVPGVQISAWHRISI